MAKYCGNCGAQMENSAKVCGMCGTRFPDTIVSTPKEYVQSATSTVIQDAPAKNVKANSGVKQIIISILALLNVMLVPIYDVWGGLFPSNPDSNFWDVVSGNCDPDEWVFVLTLAIAIPTVLMLIFAIIKKPKVSRVFGGIGIISVAFMIFEFISQFEFSDLFDFDDGNLCIGFWIALGLFIIMALSSTKKSPNIT